MDSTRGVDRALAIPFAIAVVFMAFAWGAVQTRPGLTAPLNGAAEFDFSKSFASTLTAVGALLGTIISAGVLPEETVNLSKGAYVGLNLTFGIAIVIAATLAGLAFKPKGVRGKSGNEWKVESLVWPFLLAGLVTLWAVFGEMYTLFWLIGELGPGDGFTLFGIDVLRGLLIVGALALFPYTLLKIKIAVQAPVPSPSAKDHARKASRRKIKVEHVDVAGSDAEHLITETELADEADVEIAARPIPLL